MAELRTFDADDAGAGTTPDPPVRPDPPHGATVTDVRSSPPPGGPAQPMAPGALLGGRYRLERFIAAGGMGEVHEATDQLLDERIAVKLLRAELVRKPGAQARFADEIRLARRVTHVNVCRVFEVGVDGERVFYTMALHPGETLKARMRRVGPMAPAQVRPIASQVLAGIGAAHAAGVVHADLKPSNVLLDERGRVVITDFGLALPLCTTPGCRLRHAAPDRDAGLHGARAGGRRRAWSRGRTCSRSA